MDQDAIDKKVDEFDASRPGPKTLAAAVVAGLIITGIYHWSVVKDIYNNIL